MSKTPTTTPKPETSTENPRLGYTSASNALQDLLCPGRHIAQRGMPGYITRESEHGSTAHAAFAGDIALDEINPMQRRAVELGMVIEHHVVRGWYAVRGVDLMTLQSEEEQVAFIRKRAHREIRLWAKNHLGQRCHSGALDALWFTDDMQFALIEDFKSLFGEVDDVTFNQQLSDYAALVALNYGCKEVWAFVNQPLINPRPVAQKLAYFNEQDVQLAIKRMRMRVEASNDISAKRVPSVEACKYCLAAGTPRCPESTRAIEAFARGDIEKDGYDVGWMFREPEQRTKYLDLTRNVLNLCESTLALAREKIKENPDVEFAPGYLVMPDSQTRVIEDVSAVAAALADAYPNEDVLTKLAGICKISVGELEELHKKLHGGKPKDAKAAFNVLFADLISTKPRKGSLKRV